MQGLEPLHQLGQQGPAKASAWLHREIENITHQKLSWLLIYLLVAECFNCQLKVGWA